MYCEFMSYTKAVHGYSTLKSGYIWEATKGAYNTLKSGYLFEKTNRAPTFEVCPPLLMLVPNS